MSLISTLTLQGHSGKYYEFSVYSLDTEFKSIQAVYVITMRDFNKKHDVIYIGQTNDLSERLDNHHKFSCFMRKNANCFCIKVENNSYTRLAIEKDLVNQYNPPCNL